MHHVLRASAFLAVMAGLLAVPIANAQEGGKPPAKEGSPKPDFPPLEKVTEGFQKVSSSAADSPATVFTAWTKKADGSLLIQLPKDFAKKKYFFALTVASGTPFAGLQSGDLYLYWRRYDKKLALIEPNLEVRSTGDSESKRSVERLFTDKVLLDTNILALGGDQNPVIDLRAVLLDNLTKFFPSAKGTNTKLAALKTLKLFPENLEVAYEVPSQTGSLQTYHFSISEVPPSSGYKPRVADPRIGYFTTTYRDFGMYKGDEVRTRYINRWRLEKADPKLKLGPPKKPIKYYVESTTPLRYRRWVAAGALYWNQAFEKIGFSNVIQIEFQDPANGNMSIDPEDVRYNFIRWLNNGIGTAIGPSRVHPETGEILDADVVLTDGWIRSFQTDYNELLPQLAMEGYGAETLEWLDKHPQWDPRVRLGSRNQKTTPGADVLADFKLGPRGATCAAASGMAFNLDQLRMSIEILGDELVAKDDEDMVDGIPASFIGPLLADLVAHEVGHTLGLRHNFKASSIYTLADINSEKLKGSKPFAGSVMDYIAPNIGIKDGKLQGDWAMIGVGPYDLWAIEYGYTTKDDLKPILARVAEPELAYATDPDTVGPDPLARRYDFSKDPIDFANSQLRLAKYHRERLLEKFVKDGENWEKARKGYLTTLAMQTRAVSMMANWVGGAHVHRDHKGDPKARPPLVVVPAATQRAALSFVLENAFKDSAFGLSPEIAQKLVNDGHYDGRGDDTDFPIHDRVLGMQTSTLTALMNPTRLRRVYDNEFRVPATEDAFTLPELLDKITDAVWADLDVKKIDEIKKQKFTARKPMLSSLRRNLQREHIDRLIDLSMPAKTDAAASKPIANLAAMQLRGLQNRISGFLALEVDPYTKAHLTDAEARIKKALEATMIVNTPPAAPGGGRTFIVLEDGSLPKELRLHPAGCSCGKH